MQPRMFRSPKGKQMLELLLMGLFGFRVLSRPHRISNWARKASWGPKLYR
uniref:Uncharacterized protein n=1 Tax=Lotus japonicus TaxID=34305 RepID=I3SPF6_LOTJA|nr:unknown [Lotus japonicus]